MILPAFTLFHIALSLAGIGSGLVVLYGFLTSKWSSSWNTVSLTTTVATSVTEFLFPLSPLLAFACRRHFIACGSRHSASRALPFPSRGRLAPDLRHHGFDCTLFQRLCPGRPNVPKNAGTQSPRIDAIGGSIQGKSIYRAGAVRSAYYSRRGQVSQRSATREVSGDIVQLQLTPGDSSLARRSFGE